MLPIVDYHVREAERREINLRSIRQRIKLRAENNPFDLSDARFMQLFRLNKRLVRHLKNLLEPLMANRVSRKGISLETKILCALRFYAVGSYQRGTGQDYNCGLSQTSVHRCIKAVTEALATIAEEVIQMPHTQHERNNLKFQFMDKWGFPGTIGAIDCFHVSILKPVVNEQNYINRKGYHSINVQIICDDNLKIRNLFANFGGSSHDSFIWRASEAQRFMRDLYDRHEQSWLIGDSGYPLQPYILTPFRNPANNIEVRYNTAHIRARNCVERCIGVMKMRFRCLHKERSSRYSPEFMCAVTKACAVLHNMCIDEHLEWEDVYHEDNDDIPANGNPELNNNFVVEGLRRRQYVVNHYFR